MVVFDRMFLGGREGKHVFTLLRIWAYIPGVFTAFYPAFSNGSTEYRVGVFFFSKV